MKNFLKKWKGTIALGLVIFILALGLRLYKLTYLPIFGDEAIYIRWAQVMRVEPTLRFLPLSDGKQPLFMWLVIPFLKVFSDPLFAGRMVSVGAGMATLAGVFALSYLIFKSRKVALAAAIVYGLCPFAVFFDRMALADSMLSAFGVWTLFFAILTAKKMRLDFAMITGFTLGGALLTKSPALFFAILLPSAWILSDWPKSSRGAIVHLIKLAALSGVSVLIALVIYNILRLGPNFQMVALRNQDYVFPISHLWENPKHPFIFHIKEIGLWIWMLGPGVFTALVLTGLVTGIKKNAKETLLVLAWVAFPLFLQAMYARVFTARYIFFSLPFFVVLAGGSFALKRKDLKKILLAVFLVFVLHALTTDRLILFDIARAPLPRSERSGYLEEWTSGYGIRETGEIIREIYNKKQRQIVVGTEGFFGTLPDGLQIYLNDLPQVKVIGVGVIIKDLPVQLKDSKKAGNPTYFIINSTRYIGDPEASGLKLLASYPKALRPNTSRESLLFFEVKEDF